MQTQSNLDDVQGMMLIDSQVHLGVGWCSDLKEYLALKPRQLLLVEDDPQLVEALKSRTESQKQVQVNCAAGAGQPGPASVLIVLNTIVNTLKKLGQSV